MKLIKKKNLSLVVALFIMAVPVLVGAQWNPLQGSPGTGLVTDADFSQVLTRVLKWALGILSVLAVIAFVGSGILWITAGGGEGTEKAKKWLTGSIIGLIVALLGYVIVVTIDRMIRGA